MAGGAGRVPCAPIYRIEPDVARIMMALAGALPGFVVGVRPLPDG
jgi:hypothetical protein